MLQLSNHKLRTMIIPITRPLKILTRLLRMPLRRIIHRPGPIHNRLRRQTRMAHLRDQAPHMLVHDLLEVRVREVDAADDVFLALDLDVVADVVGVFAEAEDGAVDEFGDGAGEGEGESDDADPEGAEFGGEFLVGEELDWIVLVVGCGERSG